MVKSECLKSVTLITTSCFLMCWKQGFFSCYVLIFISSVPILINEKWIIYQVNFRDCIKKKN
jgi:hypothetical protein